MNTQAGTPEADCVVWFPWLGSHSQFPSPPIQCWADTVVKVVQGWDLMELGAGCHLRCGVLSQHHRWFAESRWSRRPGQNRVQKNARDWRWGTLFFNLSKKGIASRELFLQGSQQEFPLCHLLLSKAEI